MVHCGKKGRDFLLFNITIEIRPLLADKAEYIQFMRIEVSDRARWSEVMSNNRSATPELYYINRMIIGRAMVSSGLLM